MRGYVAQSKVVEMAHLASFVFLCVICVVLLFKRDWLGLIIFSAVNVMLNAYPILVARYNRHRIERRVLK